MVYERQTTNARLAAFFTQCTQTIIAGNFTTSHSTTVAILHSK